MVRNDGQGAWPTITTLGESPKQPGVYYTGTDDGTLSVSKDGGIRLDKLLAKIGLAESVTDGVRKLKAR